jgi:hypothetical protein
MQMYKQNIIIGKKNQEIGIKINYKLKKNDEIYKIIKRRKKIKKSFFFNYTGIVYRFLYSDILAFALIHLRNKGLLPHFYNYIRTICLCCICVAYSFSD